MLRKGVVLLLVLSFAGIALGYVWDDDSGDHRWRNPVNWDPDGTPTLSDDTIGHNADPWGSQIIVDGDAYTSTFQMRYNVGTAVNSLTITSTGNLQCDGSFETYAGISTVNVNAGGILSIATKTLDTVGTAKLGGQDTAITNVYGTLNVLSQNIDPLVKSELQVGTAAKIGGTSLLTIGATGVVNCNLYSIGDGVTAGLGVIDILTNGHMVIDGDVRTQVLADVTAGRIKGDGVAGAVAFTYDSVADKTYIVPEPMTIALLGFGGLLLRKRR